MKVQIKNGLIILVLVLVVFALGMSMEPIAGPLIFVIVFSAYWWFKDNRFNQPLLETERAIEELKTIVFSTTNASSEGDLDNALRLYFEKKSVVENLTNKANFLDKESRIKDSLCMGNIIGIGVGCVLALTLFAGWNYYKEYQNNKYQQYMENDSIDPLEDQSSPTFFRQQAIKKLELELASMKQKGLTQPNNEFSLSLIHLNKSINVQRVASLQDCRAIGDAFKKEVGNDGRYICVEVTKIK